MRTYYSEYVNHCLRFYCKNPGLESFRSEVDEKNWRACNTAFNTFSDENKAILLKIFRTNDSIFNNVNRIALQKDIDPYTIWKLVDELRQKVAEGRKLI